jgi:N-acetylglucosamine-6-phosphate deacetylase
MVTAGVGLSDAVSAATRVPANLIGRPDLGRIAPGAAADLAWLGGNLRAQATWVAGEAVYSTQGLLGPGRIHNGRDGVHLAS